MGKKNKNKSDLNVKTNQQQHQEEQWKKANDDKLSEQDEPQDEASDEYESDTPVNYSPELEKLIDKQTTMALVYLFFYSCLMFTLPFGSYFIARDFLIKYSDYDEQTVTVLSVIAAVATVYAIIAAYVYHAYHEIDVPVPRRKKIKKK